MPDRRASAAPRFLLIDRASGAGDAVGAMLAELPGTPPDLEIAACGKQALGALRQAAFDAVLADAESLFDLASTMEEAVGRVARASGSALVIVLSEAGSVSAALAAMRAGAHDVLTKPIDAPHFAARMCELGHRHGNAKALSMETGGGTQGDFAGFVGSSEQMQIIYDQIRRIAPSDAPVFITGESGTGKKLCAEALHQHGPRANKPFVMLNCAALPHDLMDAAIFGAAFDPRSRLPEDRPGAAEKADGGIVFLDEVGELDPGLQSKLLRFLQTGSVMRVGETVSRPVDVRVICTTSRNPMQLIAEKRFREDLFYRLHVLPIHLPPLRQRPSDILPLAESLLTRFSAEGGKSFTGLSRETADLFVAREWPGNVRQLQTILQRIVMLFDGPEVTAEMVATADMDTRVHSPRAQAPALQAHQPIEPMWMQEKRIIEAALSQCGGNIAQAAAALQISPSTIYRKRQCWDEEDIAGAA